MKFIIFFILCFVGQAQNFEHFYLREFAPKTELMKNVFREDPFFQLNTFPDSWFDDRHDVKFFSSREESGLFKQIDLKRKYYYDSKARAHKKILVILFGTLWDPQTIEVLKDMREIHQMFSNEELNQKVLARQVQTWFKNRIHTGFLREDLFSGKAFTSTQWEEMQSSDFGFRLFHPDNTFILFNHLYELLSSLPYPPDVTFAFIAVAGEDSDAQELMKDQNLPFAFLNDPDSRVKTANLDRMVPGLMIVDHNGKIRYKGEVLSYDLFKLTLDRLMMEVFDYRGKEIQEVYHQIRLERHEQKVEDEISTNSLGK